MLKNLRLRLTLLFFFGALFFIALLAGGSYYLLDRYFRTTTDLALKYRLVQELHRLNLPVPEELGSEQFYWSQAAGTGSESDDAHPELDEEASEAFSGELAPIFAMVVDVSGNITSDLNAIRSPIQPVLDGIRGANAHLYDLRTIQASNGANVRLLTYRIPEALIPAYIQIGRLIGDQSRLLNQYMIGTLIIGGAALLMLGAASWLMAGRSIKPAQRAFEQQQAFVANASHELRTPLAVIRAEAELAVRQLKKGEPQQLIGGVLQDVDGMTTLVEDLLMLSRLDARAMKFEKQPVELNNVFNELVEKGTHLVKKKGVKLDSLPTSEVVSADPARLAQVLWILVDNALQHTQKGQGITLSAEKVGGRVHLQVSDTGEGIPPEDLRHVFERFYKSKRAEEKGAGLGLSIAKGLVEGMGGKIDIQSQVGRGTTATIILSATHI
jgi:signal transduction histidine kinase